MNCDKKNVQEPSFEEAMTFLRSLKTGWYYTPSCKKVVEVLEDVGKILYAIEKKVDRMGRIGYAWTAVYELKNVLWAFHSLGFDFLVAENKKMEQSFPQGPYWGPKTKVGGRT